MVDSVRILRIQGDVTSATTVNGGAFSSYFRYTEFFHETVDIYCESITNPAAK